MNVDQLPERMQAKIVSEVCPVAGLPGFCWGWTGALNGKGYGCWAVDGKSQLSHRVSYERLVGPIPDGLQIDHLCVNKRCCNPAHLEPVTGKVNSERTDAATKMRCVNGHPLIEPNLVIKKRAGGLTIRNCRVCSIDSSQRRNEAEWTGARGTYKSSAVKRAAKRARIIAAAEQALAESYGVAS